MQESLTRVVDILWYLLLSGSWVSLVLFFYIFFFFVRMLLCGDATCLALAKAAATIEASLTPTAAYMGTPR